MTTVTVYGENVELWLTEDDEAVGLGEDDE